ncbi:hypothetical protein [Enterobacter hormaechei]|uniref:hypothetical protein n=1 Tax=Enterobacter hormaechei TaxID=158836 RepID=UPI000AE0FF68|nr:hypothetical protein [Enterobacter hormaechei]
MSSHYISGRNGIEYLAKSLAHSRKGTTQITATQSIDTDDETLAVLSVSCDWQIKTAGDAPHAGSWLSLLIRGSERIGWYITRPANSQ